MLYSDESGSERAKKCDAIDETSPTTQNDPSTSAVKAAEIQSDDTTDQATAAEIDNEPSTSSPSAPEDQFKLDASTYKQKYDEYIDSFEVYENNNKLHSVRCKLCMK